MAISTLQPVQVKSHKFRYSNIIIYISAVLLAAVLIFFGKSIFSGIKNLRSKSAISVGVFNGRAELFLNDEMLGVTPFESEEIKPGNNKITLRSSNMQYETTINFLSNSDKYIHKVGIFRDLGISDLFSSGQDLWFEENTSGVVLRVISEPTGSSVFVDGTEIGKTPFTSTKLSEGDYDLRVEHVGYEPQKARIRIQEGYTSNVSIKLFPMPVPSRISSFEGSDNLYDAASDNNQIISDTETWVKAIVYWNQTRGINLEGVGINKDLVFDYFVDYKGNIFDLRGDLITDIENNEDIKDADRGAYLGRISDGLGLTEPATEALKKFKNIRLTTTTTKAKILPTGTGWLRVRNDPSINGSEVTKVDVGKEYPLLEEGTDWVKILVSEEIEGWVSKTYVEITNVAEEVVEELSTESADLVE